MKKLFLIALVSFLTVSSIFAENKTFIRNTEKHPENWSNISYQNIPILKVLEARDAYVVIYQKNSIGVGTTVIPKKWAKGNPENPRKLKFRKIRNPAESFMTIVNKDGKFQRVILTMPLSKQNNIWGLADYTRPLEGVDKENLDDIVL